ncbi:MAG: hypothetical protein ACI867_002481, partial [Glaciecola sp.]
GRTYLEVYFEGFGWVPIVGVPRQARSAFSDSQQDSDPFITPTDDVRVQVFVPVALQTLELLFQKVRYWLGVLFPILVVSTMLVIFYPGIIKAGRRSRRQWWASRLTEVDRVMVAYGEFRDAAIDLNVPGESTTPLEFLEILDEDPEHRELAWLTTRAVWGDLQRGMSQSDARSAERMAVSVTQRLKKAQPGVTRLAAFASRASLREPYFDSIPNFWRKGPPRRRRKLNRVSLRRRLTLPAVRGVIRGLGPKVILARARRVTTKQLAVTILAVLVFAAAVAGRNAGGSAAQDAGQQEALAAQKGALIFQRLGEQFEITTSGGMAVAADVLQAPELADGQLEPVVAPAPGAVAEDQILTFIRQGQVEENFAKAGASSLTAEGRLYTLTMPWGETDGYLQLTMMRPDFPATRDDVRDGILGAIGNGSFEAVEVRGETMYLQEERSQTYVAAFAADGSYFSLLVAKRNLADPTGVLWAAGRRILGEEGRVVSVFDYDPARGMSW